MCKKIYRFRWAIRRLDKVVAKTFRARRNANQLLRERANIDLGSRVGLIR
jgi:hypothetical protein